MTNARYEFPYDDFVVTYLGTFEAPHTDCDLFYAVEPDGERGYWAVFEDGFFLGFDADWSAGLTSDHPLFEAHRRHTN